MQCRLGKFVFVATNDFVDKDDDAFSFYSTVKRLCHMDQTQAYARSVGNLPSFDSHEDSAALLDVEHSSRIQQCGGRACSYPLKRYPLGGRYNGVTEFVSNGSHRDMATMDENSNGVHLLKSKSFTGRSKKTDKAEVIHPKRRSCVSRVIIVVVVCCIFVQAMLQRSFLMFSRHMDLDLSIIHSQDVSLNTRFTYPMDMYDSGYKLKFVPKKLQQRLMKRELSMEGMRVLSWNLIRSPQLALVCFNLERSPESLYLFTIAKAIKELGYHLELYTFHDGPMQSAWLDAGITPKFLGFDGLYHINITVDWLRFEGVLVISLNCKHVISSLMQDPFRAVPVVWIILEDSLGQRIRMYESPGLMHLFFEWKQTFKRADIIVFPDYTLPMLYAPLDTGNILVIPGSPLDSWEAKQYNASNSRDEVRVKFGLRSQDYMTVVVGSTFTYKWVWREHALIMRAILPVIEDFENMGKRKGSFKIIFACGNSTSGYDFALQMMAHQLGLLKATVSHFGLDDDMNGLLLAADFVIYSSLQEEQAFPNILTRAMAFGRVILAPNSTMFQSHIADGVSGFLFPAGDIGKLSHAISKAISKNSLSGLSEIMTFDASSQTNNPLVADLVIGYAKLLELVVDFPSAVKLPLSFSEISETAKRNWQWQFIVDANGSWPWETFSVEALNTFSLVHELEIKPNGNHDSVQPYRTTENTEPFSIKELERERNVQIMEDIERREEEEVEERQESPHRSWEDVYRTVKRAERSRGELHERDDGELERTAQPLCIYEPYHGTGAWPFIHKRNPLYRGISLVPRQRRLGSDDIDASLRLPLLKDSYYQGVLCEYGAFFALANRIDRVHKNGWIGFQSWQSAARNVVLSPKAEKMLVDAARVGRDGDAVYFWAPINNDGVESVSEKIYDFWSFCDAKNNGHCRQVFLQAFKKMYGLPLNWTSLPPMPSKSGTWAASHCWVMPTSSFVEFIMFARIFVDALDSYHYMESHDQGICYLGISKFEVEHCYCRLLELLVNVWAYHSARRMFYVEPTTGYMHEQHALSTRRGHMWVKFFSSSMLKGLDEDLAEEADAGLATVRWLWPHTGEIFSSDIYERERRERNSLKMVKRRKNKERVERIRSRHRQKPLAGG